MYILVQKKKINRDTADDNIMLKNRQKGVSRPGNYNVRLIQRQGAYTELSIECLGKESYKVNGQSSEGNKANDAVIKKKDWPEVYRVFDGFKSGTIYKDPKGESFPIVCINKNPNDHLGEDTQNGKTFYKKVGERSPFNCAEPHALVNALSELNECQEHNIEVKSGSFSPVIFNDHELKTCAVCEQWVKDNCIGPNVLDAINNDLNARKDISTNNGEWPPLTEKNENKKENGDSTTSKKQKRKKRKKKVLFHL